LRKQPCQVLVNDYLTWESARLDDFLQNFDCPPPTPLSEYIPSWYKNLKGDLSHYRTDQWRYNHTARWCRGLQGISQIGWTIPLPVEIGLQESTIGRKSLVPEMLYGTVWNEKDDAGHHVWDFTIVFWPWRARLSKGWKMMVTSYPLDWNPDWFTFSGLAPANCTPNPPRNSLGNMYLWEQPLDTDNYDYYNIETVHASRVGTSISKGEVTFSLIIIPPEGKI
jgi:hypothetical protein